MKKPSKKYERFMRKIEVYSFFQRKRRAVKLLKDFISEPWLSIEEKSSAFIRLGYLLHDVEQYEEASQYFHEGLLLGREIPFPYSPYFPLMFEAFKKALRHDLYEFWYEDFVKRRSYDEAFRNMEAE